MQKFYLFLAFLLFSGLQIQAASPQAWGTALLPFGKYRKVEFLFRQEYRFEQSSFTLADALLSLYAETELKRWLEGGIHYTLIRSRRSGSNDFNTSGRLELELNPRFDICERAELKLRNRYELISRDRQPNEVQRFRQKHQLIWKTECRPLSTISIHNEVTYNITEKEVNEIRFVPIELGFEWKHTYKLFSMVRWRKPDGSWNPQFISGLHFIW